VGPSHPQHRSGFSGAHGGCYVAHAAVWRRYTSVLGHGHVKSVDKPAVALSCFAAGQAEVVQEAKTSAFQGFWARLRQDCGLVASGINHQRNQIGGLVQAA